MNKYLKIILLLSTSLLLLSCTENAQNTEVVNDQVQQVSRETEEAKVYSLLLNEDPKQYLSNSPVIIILSETEITDSYFSNDDFLLKELPALTKKTLTNYREVNEQKQTIQLLLSLDKPYEIIDNEAINRRKAEDPEWLITHTITIFSGIGFNNTFDQALVYMLQDSCGECVEGNLYFLVRDGKKWSIERVLDGPVS